MSRNGGSMSVSRQNPSIVVIGAGIAGLAVGCYGQMNGFETRIFEMHDRPGGLCTSWRRDGYIFDGCIHNLAGTGSKTVLRQVWDELGAFQGREIINFDEFTCVESPDGKRLRVYTNLDLLETHMLELSPKDSVPIKEYIQAARKFTKLEFLSLPMYGAGAVLKVMPFITAIGKWGKITLEKYAQRFGDPFLRRAFPLIQYDISGIPAMINLQFLAGLHNGDLGWPQGGSLEFSIAIAKRYQDLGGQVVSGAKVGKILVDNDNAVGIRLADGTEVEADIVVSAADGHATIFDMLEGKYLNEAITRYYDNAPKSQEFAMQVSFGVNMDLSKEPRLLVLLLEEPISVAGSRLDRLDVEVFSSSTSLAPTGKSVVKVSLPSSHEYWEDLYRSRPDYDSAKRKVADTLTQALNRRFPGFSEKVEIADVATPITFQRFAGTWRGLQAWSAPGLGGLIGGVSRTLPGLKRFYMAGQWAEGMIGVSTAAISGRNLIKRLCRENGRPFVTYTGKV